MSTLSLTKEPSIWNSLQILDIIKGIKLKHNLVWAWGKGTNVNKCNYLIFEGNKEKKPIKTFTTKSVGWSRAEVSDLKMTQSIHPGGAVIRFPTWRMQHGRFGLILPQLPVLGDSKQAGCEVFMKSMLYSFSQDLSQKLSLTFVPLSCLYRSGCMIKDTEVRLALQKHPPLTSHVFRGFVSSMLAVSCCHSRYLMQW